MPNPSTKSPGSIIMNPMTLSTFFDELVNQYLLADSLSESSQRTTVFRIRQRSISSIAEDLFAALLHDVLTSELSRAVPVIKLYFRVDSPVKLPNGKKVWPDIAIIVDGELPLLVSYIDLKTDLGYKRHYYEQLERIRNHVIGLRETGDCGLPTSDLQPRPVIISKNIIWRTVVLTEENISPRSLVDKNKEKAKGYNEYFKLYFLSGGKHPNVRMRDKIDLYDEAPFKELIDDLKTEIKAVLPSINGVSDTLNPKELLVNNLTTIQ